MSYLFNEFDVQKMVWVRKGPSKRKLVRSLQKGASVAFELADGRRLTGQIRVIENVGDTSMIHYGGDFYDDDNKYHGVELSYNPRRGGYVLIKHVTPKDAPVRVHFKKSC